LSTMTMDMDFQRERQISKIRNPPNNALEGVTIGTRHFLNDCKSGIVGIMVSARIALIPFQRGREISLSLYPIFISILLVATQKLCTDIGSFGIHFWPWKRYCWLCHEANRWSDGFRSRYQ
jgi:hypothetical protein